MNVSDWAATTFPRSIITRTELNHQQRTSGRGQPWLRYSWRVILAAGITLSMILLWGEFAGALLKRDAGPIGDRLQIATIGLLALAIIWHFVLMIQTLSLAANSVARERQNHTWDMLVLTGVDAREIIRGKWWATVQKQWRSYALLAVIRAGAAVWFGANQGRSLASNIATGYSLYGYTPPLPSVIFPSPTEILLAGALIVAFTMLNLAFTAACGVLASAQIRRSALALARSITLRLLVVLGIALVLSLLQFGLTLFTSRFFPSSLSSLNGVTNIILNVSVTLLDNGVTVATTLGSIKITPLDGYAADANVQALIAAFLTMGLYLLLTRLLLRLAQGEAVRRQALPPLPLKS